MGDLARYLPTPLAVLPENARSTPREQDDRGRARDEHVHDCRAPRRTRNVETRKRSEPENEHGVQPGLIRMVTSRTYIGVRVSPAPCSACAAIML